MTEFIYAIIIIIIIIIRHVKRELYEDAVAYFDHAARVQPSEPKWRLMTASCHRRLGDLHKSYDIYLQVGPIF